MPDAGEVVQCFQPVSEIVQRIISAGTPDLSGRALNGAGSLPHECSVPPEYLGIMPLTNHDPVRQQSGAKATAVQTLRVISEPLSNRASPALRETAAVDRRSRPPTARPPRRSTSFVCQRHGPNKVHPAFGSRRRAWLLQLLPDFLRDEPTSGQCRSRVRPGS